MMRAILTRLAIAAASVALAACNGIGDGNTITKLEIVPAFSGTQAEAFEQGGTYRLYQCLRDELLVQGTFDNGSVANFNTRATWTSSDETVVKVSNRDIPGVFISGGEFTEFPTQPYIHGTVIPQATAVPGDTATITATFAGLSARINIIIRKPQLRVVPVPHDSSADPFTFVGPASLGVRTSQRLSMVGKFDGRVFPGIGPGSVNAVLNPVLWTFPAGEYRVVDEDDDTTFDNLWVIPGALPEEPYATLATALGTSGTFGTVRGLIADPAAYEVEAGLSLCPDATDPDLKPVTTVRVLPFDTTTPISFTREAGFHDAGEFTPPAQFTAGQMAGGTNQILRVVGHLDSDGDNIGDIEQNLSEQVRFNAEPKDASCDAKGFNCGANTLFAIAGTTLGAASTATGRVANGFDLVCLTDPDDIECGDTDMTPDPVLLEACFPFCPPRLVSLAMDPPVGFEVTLTATPYNMPGTLRYVFDCDDGTGVQDNGTVDTITCDYTGDTGPFTPTVRVLENDAAVTTTAGAVQVNFDAAPVDNRPPTAFLSASPAAGTGPVTVFLTASGVDPDEDDAIAYYEFEPDDGIVIRQASSLLAWVYQTQPMTGFPAVTTYDTFNTASAQATPTTALTINGSGGPAPVRSAALSFEAIPATPCELRISPAAAAATTEVAYTFPGTIFRAFASFVAGSGESAGDCDTDPVIGTQDVTRYMVWNARPDAESEEFSDFVTVRSTTGDYQRAGQVFYLDNVEADSTVAIVASPGSLTFLKDVEAPVASSLTVQPCPDGTCPPN